VKSVAVVCCCCRWLDQAGARQASSLFYPQFLVVETFQSFARVRWSEVNSGKLLVLLLLQVS
jgi:hypothetical protein